jgi:hypothetical protein
MAYILGETTIVNIISLLLAQQLTHSNMAEAPPIHGQDSILTRSSISCGSIAHGVNHHATTHSVYTTCHMM